MSFWNTVPKPFFVLAPMADVTDAAFRNIIAKYGKPDVMFTEFVSVDGLCSRGRDRLLMDLKYEEKERPIVAQLFGATPKNFYEATKLCVDLGFNGIDINMGCPEKNILRQGACGALIKNPSLAKEIILAAKEGAKKIPVSIKTRIGFSKNEIETWLPHLLETRPAAITIHGRLVKEMSQVSAHWDVIGRAVEIRNEFFRRDKAFLASGDERTLIIGNGDVKNLQEAKEKALQYGVDGVMFGRAIFGNPWLFIKHTPTIPEKLKVMLEHAKLFENIFNGISAQGGSALGGKNFSIMKKHFKAYVEGFQGAKELRIQLMQTKNAHEVEILIQQYLKI